jgi:RNase P/RNase MRP subunit p30
MSFDPNNIELMNKKVEFSRKLGIKNLIIEFNTDIRKVPKDIKAKLDKLEDFNIYYRFNLNIESTKEFRKKIREFQRYPYIISVEAFNKKVQINAAKDTRIDILSFSDINILQSLTPGIISLTKQNNSFIEFSLNPIMIDNKINQSKNFRKLYKFINMALELKANILINGNFSNPYYLRNPRSLISICTTLLEIPLMKSKYFFRENVLKLLERVENRNKNNNVEDTIKII